MSTLADTIWPSYSILDQTKSEIRIIHLEPGLEGDEISCDLSKESIFVRGARLWSSLLYLGRRRYSHYHSGWISMSYHCQPRNRFTAFAIPRRYAAFVPEGPKSDSIGGSDEVGSPGGKQCSCMAGSTLRQPWLRFAFLRELVKENINTNVWTISFPKASLPLDALHAITSSLDRPHWTRLWILQEVSLPWLIR